ncbi:hypothetical protein SCE1572_44030 [Sorangium cellulosum So0157-2]|uniref:Uncharacterized protein n=1 Tax=Sorangium cellulosum So0157-2 TaxID=1254432 RepID=S4Y9A9_SORCE|nr:hypothetical protein SCE1572_44030 [Sorangium cellulosum So0157-2]
MSAMTRRLRPGRRARASSQGRDARDALRRGSTAP